MIDAKTKFIGMVRYLAKQLKGCTSSGDGYCLRYSGPSPCSFLTLHNVPDASVHLNKKIVQIEFSPQFEVSIRSFNERAIALNNAIHYHSFRTSQWDLDQCIELVSPFIIESYNTTIQNDTELNGKVNDRLLKIRADLVESIMEETLTKLGTLS